VSKERELVANRMSDAIVELMNSEGSSGAPTEAILMGLLLGLLSFGETIPVASRAEDRVLTALLATAEMMILQLGGIPVPVERAAGGRIGRLS
jgi:hypothetical protein